MPAQFKVRGEVLEVKTWPKIAKVKVKAERGRFDLKTFDVAAVRDLRERDNVEILGDLRWQKPREEGGKWELDLVFEQSGVTVLGGAVGAAQQTFPGATTRTTTKRASSTDDEYDPIR